MSPKEEKIKHESRKSEGGGVDMAGSRERMAGSRERIREYSVSLCKDIFPCGMLGFIELPSSTPCYIKTAIVGRYQNQEQMMQFGRTICKVASYFWFH